MADSQTNININIDTSQALANLKALQSQISAFQTSMARGSATQAANAAKLRQNLVNDINATKKFSASIQTIQTTTESFTEALEKNKLSMGQYFKYAGASTKTFGKLFKSEFATIEKVARERVKTLQTQYIQLGRDAQGAMKAIAVRPLVLDMENLGTKTAIAAQKQQILNQLLKQGSTNMLNWGKNTQWAGRQLMVGFTIPLTMAGTAAAKAFMEMEQAVIKFKRVYGELETTATETDKMAKELQKLAAEYTKYGIAVSKTMDMAATAAATGKTGADLLQQVANATKLAVLGGVEQAQALETTISLTNAFGTAAKDLAGNIDFLNAVENQTVTSIEDLTEAIPKAAPVIKQLGGDVKDLAFFLTAMREGGINASEGANALKSGIASMINPTQKASEFLAGFGINLKGIVEANKGDVKGMVVGFAQALNQLDPLNRARAIEQLFGKFQFARISTLFKNVTEQGSQANKVLELTSRTSQELAILSERELKKVESSPMFKFQKTIEDLKKELIPIGEAFLKAITPIVKFAGEALANFNKLGDGAKTFWIGVTTVVAGIGPVLLMTVGLIANGIANLIKMFAGIKAMFNRTAGDTTVLGEATDYMTQKQLEAASVAASLEQVHQTLEQRFTSEAGSLERLTAAYQNNIAAQSQYTNANVIPTNVDVDGYASGGIIRGPGSGTSDSILAMVSNGEAIIPASVVKKNPGLIKQLVSGNIPGFSKGGVLGFEQAHTASELPQTAAVLAEMDKVFTGFSTISERLRSVIKILPDATVWKSETLNQSARAGGLTRSEFEAEWAKSAGHPLGGFGPLADRARAAGQLDTGSEIDEAVKNLDVELGKRVADKIDNGNIDKSVTGWLDDLIEQTTNQVIEEFATKGSESQQKVASAYRARAATPATIRTAAVQDLIDPATGLPYKDAEQAILDMTSRGELEARTNKNGNIDYYAPGTDFKFGRTNSRGKARSNSISPGAMRGMVLGGAYETGPMPTDKLKTNDPIGPANLGAEDIKSYAKGMKSAVTSEDDPFKTIEDKSKRNSPHRDAATLGAEDGQAYKSAFGNVSAADPLAAVKTASAKPVIDVEAAQQKLTKKSLKIVSDAVAEQGDLLAGVKGKVIVLNDGLKQMSTSATEAANAAEEAANATQTSTDSKTENTQATEENTSATDKNTDSKENNSSKTEEDAAEQKRFEKNRTKAKYQRAFGTVGKIGAAATTIVGMASMIPGKIGEVAQAVTPSIGAFTSLTAMVNGPVTGALAALIAVVGGIVMAIMNLDKAYNETQQKVLAMKNIVGTSTESIRGLSEFAGRVSAGELMDKVRYDQMKLVYAAPGKTTFGESYVQSEQGKAEVSAIKEDLARKGGNTASTVASITGKLSTAVMSGALSKAEAMSIASNIGAELGNMDITMQVRAQLTEVLGPNGEKVTGGGVLNVAAGLQERNIANLSEDMQVLTQNLDNNKLAFGMDNTALNRNLQAAGTVLGSAAAGALAGAAIGSVIPGVGTAIGAIVGAIGGAIVGYNVAMGTLEEQTKAVAELGAVVAADMTATLTTQKEMSDSLDAYYLKKIEEARLEGDIAKAKKLQLEYDSKKNQLAQVGFEARQAIMDLYKTTDAAELEAVNKGLENALNVRYKDDALQQMYIPVVQEQLNTAESKNVATGEQVGLIRAEIAAGTLTPQDASNLLKIMATDQDAGAKVFSIQAKFGGTTMGQVAQVASMFSGPNAAEQKAKFIMEVEAAPTASEAQDIIDFTREVAKYAGVMKQTILVDMVQKNPAAADRLKSVFDQLEDNKGKMTASVVYEIMPTLKKSEAFDEKYFNSLKDSNEKITYVKTIATVMEMSELELNASDDFNRWIGDEAQKAGLGSYPGTHSFAWWQRQYAEDMGYKVTNALATDATTAPKDQTGGTGGSGPSASWLDPIVQRVRDLYDSSQKLTIGYKASGDALKAFAKTGKSALTGLTGMGDKLYKANLSQDIIDGILGMPKEEADKWMKMFFDKKGRITEFVKNLNATIGGLNYEKFIQENTALNNTLKNQQTATVALSKFTDNLAVSRSILNDQNATAVLAGAMLSGSLEDQKKKTQELTKAYLDNMAGERLMRDKREVDVEDAEVRIETLQAENDIYQNGIDIISKKSEKVAEVYDRQIEALNKIKSVNDEINRQKQSELDVADALSRGDIGAAAKAIQQMRAQQAQDAADRQVKALEDAKKRAIDSITVEINGQMFTRSELEGKIFDIEVDILEIKKDQILQNKLSLAQSKEELQNIIAQIAKLKELKNIKNLPDNKQTKVTGSTGNQSGNGNGTVTPGSVNDRNAHKDGDPAGGNNVWKWDGKKWTKVPKKADPTVTTDPGVSAGSTLSSNLSNGLAANKLSTLDANRMITGTSTAQAKTDLVKDVKSKLANFKTERDAFKAKYGDVSTEAEAQVRFGGDSAKLGAWMADFQKLQGNAKSINSLLGNKYQLGAPQMADAARMIFGAVENRSDGEVMAGLSQTAITDRQTSNKADLLAKLPADVKEAVAYLQSLPGTFKSDKAKYDALNKPIAEALNKLDPAYKNLDILRLKRNNDPAYTKLIKANPGISASIETLSKFSDSMIATMRNANFVRNMLSAKGYTNGLLGALFGDNTLLNLGSGIVQGSDYTGQTVWAAGYPANLARYADGGKVSGPGTGTSDSVPAMLSNGEYVVRAGAVKAIGTAALDKINNADKPHFADGGFFGGIGNFIGGAVKNVGSFVGNAAKNVGNFAGKAGKWIADATPGALQFIKDYIFDPTNPLDWASLLIPGSKALLTGVKVAVKLGSLAAKGMKVAKFAEKAADFAKVAKDPVGSAMKFAGKKAVDFSKKTFTEKVAPKFAGKAVTGKTGTAVAKTKDIAAKAKSKYDNSFFGSTNYEDLAATAIATGKNQAGMFITKLVGENAIKKPVENLAKEFLGNLNPMNQVKDQVSAFANEKMNQSGLPVFHKGGLIPGKFDVPIMAKGGEFVMSDYAVKQYGTDTLGAMNSGTATVTGDSVYNYSVSVNVANTGANPNEIARTVMAQIKQIDAQRIRSNNL